MPLCRHTFGTPESPRIYSGAALAPRDLLAATIFRDVLQNTAAADLTLDQLRDHAYRIADDRLALRPVPVIRSVPLVREP